MDMASAAVLLGRFHVWLVLALTEFGRILTEEPAAPLLPLLALLALLVMGAVVLTARIIERLPLSQAPPRRAAISAARPVALCALSAPDAPGKTQSRAPSAILGIA